MPRLHDMYNLLILITILCLSSITCAHSVETTSDLNVHARSAWDPSGEITADRRLEASTEGNITVHRRTILTASSSTSTDMPKPFDTLAYDFAKGASCIDFFAKWRADETIINCNAVSLLLENSNAFFHSLNSANRTTHILDTSCSANVSECASIMTDLAAQLVKSENCGKDYNNGNSVVKGLYRDLVAYEPVYRATCLKNPSTQDYCFVNSVVNNTTSPDDYNVYFMPLGDRLDMSATPTCNKCLKSTMEIFSGWAKRDGQGLAYTYLPSADVVNARCGAGFAATNITVGSSAITSGGGLAVPLPNLGVASAMALGLAVLTALS
ncbi:hypothetical protein N7457_002938 [Penicillium paradoxum]|uniref:uncharacterized protein n=1 Tax=Penicillium paradoxum TaxID=176176 RepID=UPI00254823E0|nr:uncharacterized protein N7457_002938 [Penicillium paradoxum]KAJ5787948.1 hypothetical protein N7457_002938 [Penicillium paradoxum]